MRIILTKKPSPDCIQQLINLHLYYEEKLDLYGKVDIYPESIVWVKNKPILSGTGVVTAGMHPNTHEVSVRIAGELIFTDQNYKPFIERGPHETNYNTALCDKDMKTEQNVNNLTNRADMFLSAVPQTDLVLGLADIQKKKKITVWLFSEFI